MARQRQKNPRFRISLVAAGLGVIATALSIVVPKWWGPTESTHSVNIRVVDGSSKMPLGEARVVVDLSEIRFQAFTGDSGAAEFNNVPTDRAIRVRVSRDGYFESDNLLDPGSSGVFVIVMNRADVGPERYSMTFNSGPKPSGPGASFSSWYELRAEPPRPGFEIDTTKSYYSLLGDRQCNAWSECSWVEQTPQSLAFRFRMQGHSEAVSNNGVGLSQGVLYVEYKRIPG